LGDELSRKSFLAAIKGWVSGQLKDYIYAAEPQYMLHGFMPAAGDVVIDGGSFDGATALDFASLGSDVYSFEMDGANYEVVKSNSENGLFTPINMGLYSCRTQARYSSCDTGSCLADDGLPCELIDIDTFSKENHISKINYIKLDVEGAELETLRGAFGSIAKYKPKMAISVYHKPEDLFAIPLYISSIRDDYVYSFRNYRIDVRNYGLTSNEREYMNKYNLSLQMQTHHEKILYCK